MKVFRVQRKIITPPEKASFSCFSALPSELQKKIFDMLGSNKPQTVSKSSRELIQEIEKNQWKKIEQQVASHSENYRTLSFAISKKIIVDFTTLKKFLFEEYKKLKLENPSELFNKCRTSISVKDLLALNQEIEDQNLIKIWPSIVASAEENIVVSKTNNPIKMRQFIEGLSDEDKRFFIDIDMNRLNLTRIPLEVFSLTNLWTIDLSKNHLIVVPLEIGKLTSLMSLCLSNNQFIELPPEIKHLKNLSILYLSNNPLVNLPEELFTLDQLSELILCNIKLAKLSSGIGNLRNLKELHLNGTRIKELPDEICLLTELLALYCSKTLLEKVPENFSNLNSLRLLELTNCPALKLSAEVMIVLRTTRIYY